MPSNKLYWTCDCGRWSWEYKSSCVGCGAPPPPWIVEHRQAKKASNSAGDVHADRPAQAASPKPRAQNNRGLRQQVPVRAQPETSGAPIESDSDCVEVEGMEVDSSLPRSVDEAERKVRQFEEVGVSVRAAIPDFDALLAAARAERDELVRQKRAQRPIQWRLVDAEKHARAKAALAQKHRNALEQLQGQQDAIIAKIGETEMEIQKAFIEQTQADAAVAAIHAEIAAGCAQPVGDLRAVADGLVSQVDALPAAFTAGNGPTAVAAVMRQVQALVSQACASSPGPTPPAHALRTGGVPSGRRGTSPAHSSSGLSGLSDDADVPGRRAEGLTDAERQATAKSRRLEDCGFRPACVVDDPYSG